MREKILNLATNISGDKLVSLGLASEHPQTYEFWLPVIILDYLALYAKYKVWVNPGAQQSFPCVHVE